MSIAVSAVIHPSRLLFALAISMCLGTGLIGIVIGVGWVGNLSLLARAALTTVCISMSCWGLNRSMVSRKSLHIDISGIGQMRLAEHNKLAASTLPGDSQQSWHSGEVVQLMTGSTLWPYLLLLRLQTKDRQVRILPILPDCVGADSFRALSVACRWVAAHNNHDEHKIS